MTYKSTKPSEGSPSNHEARRINDILETAKQISQSGEFKQWVGQTIEKANSLLNNPDWVSKTSKYVRDKLKQADEIAHSQAFQDSVANVVQEANTLLSNYDKPTGLGNQLDAIFNKFSSPELPCCDHSKHLHSADCRACPATDEL